MATTRRAAVVGVAGALVLFASAAAAAGSPVALAVEVRGETEPVLELFSEIMSGDSFQLADDAKIEFLHYLTCQSIIVEGGKVSFSDQNFTVRRGRIVDVKRSKCPQATTLAADGVASGVVMRSGDVKGRLKLGLTPAFVVVGTKADRVVGVRLFKGDRPVFEGPLEGARFRWPEGRAALEKGEDYRIDLVIDGDGEVLSFAVDLAERRGRAALVLVRVE